MYQIVLVVPIYVLFIKRIDTFSYWGIKIFWGQEADKKINEDFWTTSSLHLPKCPNIHTLYTTGAVAKKKKISPRIWIFDEKRADRMSAKQEKML